MSGRAAASLALDEAALAEIDAGLADADRALARDYPGAAPGPQPLPSAHEPGPMRGIPEERPAQLPAEGDLARKRVGAADVRVIVGELLDEADRHPDATFEITWRIVPR